MMRNLGLLVFVALLTGCSTHPCADFSDYFFPGKLYPNEVQPYGGVCIPQGPIALSSPGLPVIGAPTPFPGAPTPFPGPGAGNVVPPPLPLPGNQPPPGVQLQDPIPPLPPAPPRGFGQ